MTVKGAAKKKAGKPGIVKSQLANERAKNDQLSGQLGELMNLVKQGFQQNADNAKAIAELREQVAKAPTKAAILAAHDPSKQVIQQVLREEEDLEGLPPKPEVVLPDHIRRGLDAIERGEQEFELEVADEDDESDDVAPVAARNNPRQIRQGVHAEDTEIGQFRDRPQKSHGEARESLSPLRAEDTGIILENRHYSKDKLLHEAFMHELVCVRVHDTSDKTLTPLPEVGNGGIMQFFIRNRMQWVKRKFIEPLARAKRTTYTQRTERDDEGRNFIVNVPHTALLYPFEVIEDTPKGKRWLRNILAEPG